MLALAQWSMQTLHYAVWNARNARNAWNAHSILCMSGAAVTDVPQLYIYCKHWHTIHVGLA